MVCQKCGKCCLKVSFLKTEAEKIMQERPNLKVKFNQATFNGLTYIFNAICPFLTKEKLCEINNLKPSVCKTFPIVFCQITSKLEKQYGISTRCPNYMNVSRAEIEQAIKEHQVGFEQLELVMNEIMKKLNPFQLGQLMNDVFSSEAEIAFDGNYRAIFIEDFYLLQKNNK